MLTGLPPTPTETERYVPIASGVEVIEYAIPRVLQSLNGLCGEACPRPRSMSSGCCRLSFISAFFVELDMVVIEFRTATGFQVNFDVLASLVSEDIQSSSSHLYISLTVPS